MMSLPRYSDRDNSQLQSHGRTRAWLRYGVAVASVGVATLLMFALYDVLRIERGSVPFIFFFGAVIVSARYGGRGPGLLTIALSAVTANYFFIAPFGAFSLNRESILQVSVFVLVSYFIVLLTDKSVRAESASHESRESLATTLRSIGDGVIVTDARGQVTLMNAVAERLTGWNEQEARGRELMEVFRIVNEETRETVENPVARVLREGTVVGLANHTLLLSKGGAEIPIDDSGAPIHDRNGQLTGIVLVFHDVTERRLAEEYAAKLAAIIESSDDPILSKTLDGVITSWNAAAERMYGYTAEETVGRHISLIIPPERTSELEEILSRLKEGVRIEQLETVRVRKDGGRINVSVSVSPVKDSSGVIIGASTIARDITERKRAEGALRESEARLRAIAETASEAIITIDETSTILFVNAATQKIFGHANQEMLGQSLTMLMPEYLRHVHEAGITRYVETGHKHISWSGIELPGLHKDGREISLEVSFAEFEQDGKRYFTGVARDISERKRAEGELRESEERFRKLADAMPQIVWTGRPDGYFDYYNRRWFEYTGLTLEQTEGWGWQPVLHPDDVEPCLRRWATAIQTGEKYTIEYRFRRASDGQYRWHLGRAVPMRDAAGQIIKWFGTATDIHDQKQAAERTRFLAEAGALLATSLDYEKTLERLVRFCAPVLGDHCLVDVIKADGRIARVAVSHVDADTEEFIQVLRDYPPDMNKDLGVPRVLRTGQPEVIPETTEEVIQQLARDATHLGILRRLGLKSFVTVPLIAREHIVGALTFGSTGAVRAYSAEDLAFAREIASRAALAIDNAQLYREVRDANRAKDEFLATLSHELRTPLTPIIGWTHMLGSGRLVEAEVTHGITIIEKNAQSLTRLINDLLDMSSILSGKMGLERAPLDLGEAVREAVETVRPQAEQRGVRIEVAQSNGQAFVSGDRTRLVQVFWNLLSNAVKFSKAGGAVKVECGTSDGHAQVEVKDEGAGIEASFLPHIFERFRQADGSTTRLHGGLGIGLALVKSFAEAHGGTVEAESGGAGRGSRFTVRLPLLRNADFGLRTDETQAENEQSAINNPPSAIGTVLIIEDSRDTLDMLRVVFAARGYKTILCESADEALRVAPTLRCDIIVSDIGLPQTNGYELIERLRRFEHLRDVPAVALTGYAAATDVDEALSAGFQLHVPKPVDPGALASAVDQLLDETKRGGD